MKKLTLSIQEVANVLGVSRPTVYKLAQMSIFLRFICAGASSSPLMGSKDGSR